MLTVPVCGFLLIGREGFFLSVFHWLLSTYQSLVNTLS